MTGDEETRADTGARCPDCGAVLSGAGGLCPICAPTVDGGADAPTLADGASPAAFTGPKQIAHFRVIRELGAGGMGTVFEAHDEKMGRRVALKVMSRHQAPSGKAEMRFEQEAWIAGRLDHRHLVKVYERGQWEELSFFSMDLADGGSLFDVIRNFRRWGRDDRLGLRFGTAECVRWAMTKVLQAAEGLHYAHGRGVVHRDIKPMNLLLSGEGHDVKIADFGLAIDGEATRLTTAGNVLGTLAYMAPEQILGRQEIDARADVYALGVTLFELLTLELPHTGKTQQMYINSVLTGEARRPSRLNERVGRDLEVVIRKSLEKEPRDRYATVAEMAADLEAVMQHRPIRARPPKASERLIKWARRRPFRAALAAVLVVGAPLVAFLGDRALDQRRLARKQRIEELERETRWLLQRDRLSELMAPVSEILRLDPGHLSALQIRCVNRVHLATRVADAQERDRLTAGALADVGSILRLAPDAAWAHKLHGWVLRRLGNEEEATRAESRAESLRTADPTANDLYFDGRLALDSGDYERAVDLLSEALAVKPGSYAVLFDRAQAHERLEHFSEAIQDYRLAVALNPEDVGALLNLGRLLTSSGDVEDGARYTARALQLAPYNSHVLEELANVSLIRGRAAAASGDAATAQSLFQEAERYARESLVDDTGGVWSRLNLGASLMEQNRLLDAPDPVRIDEAVRLYEEAIARLENLPGREGEEQAAVALINSCDAWIQAGRLDRAITTCRNATEIATDEPAAYYNLAGALALQGDREAALAALEKDVALGDTDWQYLASDPWFESLRGDARFDELLTRMGSPRSG